MYPPHADPQTNSQGPPRAIPPTFPEKDSSSSSQPVSQPASQPVSQPASQPAPQSVSQPAPRPTSSTEIERVKSGIFGFDELIEGGFERDSNILMVGTSGTGKTILGMQFLYYGATLYNEPGLFISFEEEKEALFLQANRFGWDFEKLEREGKVLFLFFKPHQITKVIEEGGGPLRDALLKIGAKRVVVDSITAYGLLFPDKYKRRDSVLEFLFSLKKWKVTSLLLSEDSPKNTESAEGSIGFISDGIIALYYNHDDEKGVRVHALEVLKMRATKHTSKVCAINFEKNGARVYSDVEVF